MPEPHRSNSRWESISTNGVYSLELQTDIPIPPLKPHDVLVQVHAVSLNSRDTQIANGMYMWGISTPITPCTDCSGKIIAIGPEVTRFPLGARVASTFHPKWLFGRLYPSSITQFSQIGAHEHGVLTQYAVFDQEALVAIPDYLLFEEASTLTCAALTAWAGLFGGGRTVKPGDVVLVQGSGGVSLFAVQFARAAGARVIATSSKPEGDGC